MFLERRVYQGSNGAVYPLPFYNRVADTKVDRAWHAITLENDYLRVMVLPEIGGRIHVGQDKTNGYHFFYHQDAIKPALVGLAGPWASGGVEINWPQHHRPATFMPVDACVEEHADGSKTVWLSDHDPLARMKGMHGICLHPDRGVIELKVRAYNRTPYVQTFLWWANVATRVHEGYQSFFPPDVTAVADHAKRAMSRFPRCDGRYYGVDYAGRARDGVPAEEVPTQFVPPHCRPAAERPANIPAYAPNDLSWYANIPVPTSYMCLGSKEDFSGGYDHLARAGLVQVSNHHISPGKKQWTWGNHAFGYAWDRNLTDAGGPYIELMLGVYTDNQPDFSFLQPGETKTWSVYWYPIQQIGPVQRANEHAAVSLNVGPRAARIGVAVTEPRAGLQVTLARGDRVLRRWTRDLAPGQPLVESCAVKSGTTPHELRVTVTTAAGAQLLTYAPAAPQSKAPPLPEPATEPAAPADIASADELYVTGLHLWQYRHATRSPVLYWQEALRRDPGDSRCNTAMGGWHLRRGEFAAAETYFRAAIARLVQRNPNPAEGEAWYQLGLTLRFLGRADEAYDVLYKATWNQAWQAAGFHALAEIDCTRRAWSAALEHLDRSLRLNTDNLRARNLRVLVLRELGRAAEADAALEETLRLDPLDGWARHLRGEKLGCDTQTRMDLALDCARAGFHAAAIALLEGAKPEPGSGTAPMLQYHLACLYETVGNRRAAARATKAARAASPDYCFPARLEDMLVLEAALRRTPDDARAAYYLGNLYYDRRRHREAMTCWERAVRHEPENAVAWRNLGIAYFNVAEAPKRALQAYERAFRANPADARLLYERDQLWKRLGRPAAQRLRELEARPELVSARDDATIELCALYNQTGQPDKALAILTTRRFQPWEGGEGQTLGQYVRARLLLGRQALAAKDAARAIEHFEAALEPPPNLGEARHLLANPSDIHYWLGCALSAAGRKDEARRHWRTAAEFRGDFQEMSVRAYSDMTYFSAAALQRLGRSAEAARLLRGLRTYARELRRTPAKIDYFATSLPSMLLFEDDLTQRQQTTALFLEAQAELGLGHRATARRLLRGVLRRDPSHGLAADFVAAAAA
ncbi:DUF5107 domain-containing protein [Opitutus sp. ER46]|uniref:DUF5107 domain-containing protein n=1 Tax=Opitutus sp. ER46 TaxID=2161864 RepID=UPI0031B8467C